MKRRSLPHAGCPVTSVSRQSSISRPVPSCLGHGGVRHPVPSCPGCRGQFLSDFASSGGGEPESRRPSVIVTSAGRGRWMRLGVPSMLVRLGMPLGNATSATCGRWQRSGKEKSTGFATSAPRGVAEVLIPVVFVANATSAARAARQRSGIERISRNRDLCNGCRGRGPDPGWFSGFATSAIRGPRHSCNRCDTGRDSDDSKGSNESGSGPKRQPRAVPQE